MLNYDGALKFKSSTMQVWPIQLRVNELPTTLRYDVAAQYNVIIYYYFLEILDATVCWQDYGALNRSHPHLHLWSQLFCLY